MYASHLLKFFWPLNVPPVNGIVQFPSIQDFIHRHPVNGPDTLIVEKEAHFLSQEGLLLPCHYTFPPFGQTYFSTYLPTDLEVQYKTYEFLVSGFAAIRIHFEHSVLSLIAEHHKNTSIGTAFLISEDCVLTARHCVEGQDSFRINGIHIRDLKRIVVPIDDKKDIALLKFGKSLSNSFVPFLLGSAAILDDVMVMGYPPIPGFEKVIISEKAQVAGYLHSTTGRIITSANSYLDKQDYILISARVKGGNSGGPVLNKKGYVVGMVVGEPANDASRADTLGYGMAMPSSSIQGFIRHVEFVECGNEHVRDLKFQNDADRITFV